MPLKFIIDQVHFHFEFENKNYILFSTKNPSKTFLYFKHKSRSLRALFYGENFQKLIPPLLNQKDISCIECELGKNIKGGVSLDAGELVEFNLSIQLSNKILMNLRIYQKEKYDLIKLF
jgi:hypothetical protein